jgi:hypothetical protein
VLLSLSPAESRAQFAKGVIGGWNLSSFSVSGATEAIPDHEVKNGYCVGIFAGGPLSEYFGLRAELLYSRKGSRYDFTVTDENGQPLGQGKYSADIDYLEIPLLANFTLSTRGAVKPALFLGPAFGFEMSAKLNATYPSGVTNQSQSGGNLPNTTSPDLNLIGGGGVEITSGPHLILLQVRYVVGMVEVWREGRNRVFSVMAGIGI